MQISILGFGYVGNSAGELLGACWPRCNQVSQAISALIGACCGAWNALHNEPGRIRPTRCLFPLSSLPQNLLLCALLPALTHAGHLSSTRVVLSYLASV